jgi:hypothetical protein
MIGLFPPEPLGFAIVTARYHAFHKGGQPTLDGAELVPVRTSAGTPRFIEGAHEWPRCNEIVPWNPLKITDEAEFVQRYYARLDKHGPARIAARLREIHEQHDGRPLALLCYEDLAVSWCHRRKFADWWQQHTGQVIPEL